MHGTAPKTRGFSAPKYYCDLGHLPGARIHFRFGASDEAQRGRVEQNLKE